MIGKKKEMKVGKKMEESKKDRRNNINWEIEVKKKEKTKRFR
jgi:hypothetical protein